MKTKNIIERWIEDNNLSLFQKIFLTTDGTFTDLLKIHTGEHIYAKKIEQQIYLSTNEKFCEPDTPLLKRIILLSGAVKNYVYAESTFIFDQFPRSIQYKVLETNGKLHPNLSLSPDCHDLQPNGLLWKAEKLETYREVKKYELEFSEAVAFHLGIDPNTPILSRSYTINHNKKLMGIITEKMSITSFREDT